MSLNLNRSFNLALASSGLFDALIKAITSSILSEAIINPSKICALSSAFRNSNFVLLTITSCLNSMKWRIISRKLTMTGLPLTKQMLLTENELCRAVYLYNLFKTTFGIESRFNSYTILIPLLSDSSRISEIPSIFLSLTKSAVFLIISDLFTWYGISVTIITSLPLLVSSISALARITIFPRPVSNALRTPS